MVGKVRGNTVRERWKRKSGPKRWIADGDATFHSTRSADLLRDMQPSEYEIKIGGDYSMDVEGESFYDGPPRKQPKTATNNIATQRPMFSSRLHEASDVGDVDKSELRHGNFEVLVVLDSSFSMYV